MKNVKTPSLLQYAKSLGLMIIMSFAIAFVFNMEAVVGGNMHDVYQSTKALFLVGLAANMIIGFASSKGKFDVSGMLKNDSLVINDTTYAGSSAPYFVLPAMFSFDSVMKKVLYIKDGIKKKHTIPTMDFEGPLQPRKATPTNSGGNLEIGARVLEPQDIMAYQEMNPRNFEVHWDAENLSQTLLTRQLPATAENYIMLLLLGRSFEQFETMIWQGSTQYQNNPNVPQFDGGGAVNPYYQIQFVDGYIKRMLNDSGIYTIPGPVTITSSNIGTALNSLYSSVASNNKALITGANKYKRMKFCMSIATAQIYETFLTDTTYKNNDTTEKGIMKYKSFEIVPLAGMPDNTILFTEALSTPEGNLWLGMNSTSDENFQLARLFPNSELFFFKMLMKMDVNYGRSEKVFLYTTLTSADFIQ